MIIKLNDDLMRALFGANDCMATHPGQFQRENPALDVAGLVPKWLEEMAMENSIIVIGDDEYADLPCEVTQFIEVVKR